MKLNFGTKLSYGIGGLADNALYTLSGTYLLFYLTSVVGIDPAIAGTITALGSIWEAICGPVFGYTSDGIETRYGKRKPFLMAAAFPVAIVCGLLFTTIDASSSFKIAYYTVMTLLFWTSFSSFFVPYMTWGSELTEDYHERTVLRSYAYIFNQLGMAVGMVMPTVIVDILMNMGKTLSTGWQAAGIFTGVCAGGSLLICALTNKKSDIKNFKKSKDKEPTFSFSKLGGMFKEYCQIIKLNPIRYIIAASVMYLIANTIFSSGRVYFLTYNLGFTTNQISITMLIITVAGVALVPFISALSKKFDKKNVFTVGIGLTGVVLIGLRMWDIDSMVGVVIVCLVYSIGNTCYWQLMPSMIYDVCEVEELYSGKKHSGAVISLQALSESVSTAIGLQMLGIILKIAKFSSESSVQVDSALSWVSNSFTLLPGIFMLLVVVTIIRYPINRKVFDRVVRAIQGRSEGREDKLEIAELYRIMRLHKHADNIETAHYEESNGKRE